MSDETKHFFFPQKIITYPQDDYGFEDTPEEISPAEAMAYEDQIIAVITKESRHFTDERGLAEYLDTDILSEMVRSLHPFVEIWNRRFIV